MKKKAPVVKLSTGERIKAERLSQGLRQTAVAKLAGLQPSSLSDIESGRKQPSWGVVQRLARALDCPTDLFREE
jgi:transcriptional regulator with XRE-family HTH domain